MKRARLVLLTALLGLCCPRASLAQEDAEYPVHLSVEYTLDFIRHPSLAVPLVTTGQTSSVTTNPNFFGGLAVPDTVSLFDNRNLEYNPSSGFTADLSYAILPGLTLEFGGFYQQQQSANLTVSSDSTGTPFLVRPFVAISPNVANLTLGTVGTNPDASVIVAAPGILSGSVQIAARSQLFGLESNVLGGICGEEDYCFSWLCGARYLSLEERLDINSSSTALVPLALGIGALAPGDQLSISDGFVTHSQFVGAQGGLVFEYRWHKLWLASDLKVGVGLTTRDVLIQGNTTLNSSTVGVVTLPGGVLALPSNIGRHTSDVFGVVPEVGLKLGYDITCQLRLTAGFHFLDWSGVARASEQIPLQVNQLQQPATSAAFYNTTGAAVPAPGIHTSDLWIIGLHCGLEYRF